MKLLILLIAVVFCASQSAAAVFLRAGEHQNFIRFTLELDKSTPWDVRMGVDGFEIIFPNREFDFDITEAYRRISREDVSSVSIIENGLQFKKSCDCQVAVGFTSPGILVIDVFSDITLYRKSPISISTNASKIKQEINRAASDINFSKIEPSIKTPRNSSEKKFLIKEFTNNTFLKHAKYFRHIQEVVDMLKPKNPSLTRTGSFYNLRVTNETDGRQAATVSKSCYHYAPFLEFSESELSLVANTLPKKREAIYTELNTISPEAIYELAETYAYLGMGAEVALLIDQLESQSPKSNFLLELAGLLEHGDVKSYSIMLNPTDCVTSTPLWRMLTLRGNGPNEDTSTADVLQEFSQLPYHLKNILTPIIIERLIEKKLYASAQYVLRTVEALSGKASQELLYLRDKLDILIGGQDIDTRVLYSISQTDSVVAPSALADLIEAQTESGDSISDDLALLADSYALQFRNSEEGPALNRARIIAQAKAGNFDDAISLLVHLDSAKLETEVLANLVTEIIISEADNINFASIFYPQSPLMAFKISPSNNRRIVKRYQRLGLTSLALAWTELLEPGNPSGDEDYLEALIHYERGELHAALQLLGDSQSKASSVLRQKIWFQQGDFSRLANQPPSNAADQSVVDASLIYSMNQNRRGLLRMKFDTSTLKSQQDYSDLIAMNRHRVRQIQAELEQ